MKYILSTILVIAALTCLAQNGIQDGRYFILQKDSFNISVNEFKNDSIHEIKQYSISSKSIYTTDQKNRVAIVDTQKFVIDVFNIQTDEKIHLNLPQHALIPKCVLLSENNIFIGGEKRIGMLYQYHFQEQKWYSLYIPSMIDFPRKAIDDILLTDTTLIGVDNIVIPKYVVYYTLNDSSKLQYSDSLQLHHNGTYEHIRAARITNKYMGFMSSTMSGYIGRKDHVSIYKNDNTNMSFSITIKPNKYDYIQIYDFLIIEDRIVFLCSEGLAYVDITPSLFFNSGSDKSYSIRDIGARKIKFSNLASGPHSKLTVIPQSKRIVLSTRLNNGTFQHQILDPQTL
jgi:hypothetical protein